MPAPRHAMQSGTIALLFAVVGSVTAGQNQESTIQETPKQITLMTGDGLRLSLQRADGTAALLTIGGQEIALPGKPVVHLEEVIEDANAPDLLSDGDFASGLGKWTAPRGTVEPDTENVTSKWLKLTGDPRAFAERVVELGQTESQPIVISGRCRTEMHTTACGWMNVHLAIGAYGTYMDGVGMLEQSAYFGQYDHGPQFSRTVLCPDRPLRSLKLVLTVSKTENIAWYTDITAKPACYRITPVAQQCERVDHRIVQEFADPEAGLRGLLTYQALRSAIEIRGQIQSDGNVDRALSAYVTIPFDAVGGRWHDHFRASRAIEEGTLYRNAKWYGAGRDGWDSKYPIACVESADGLGVGIGTSVADPRVFQAEYDAHRRELRLRFDLGLTPDGGRWASRSSFSAYLFRYDPRDGFRGATEKYHHLFDWAFIRKRVQAEGNWSAFVSPQHVPGGWEDFRFQFVESVSNIGWESRQGMTTLRYAEPWISHHRSPHHAPFEETRGPADPQGAIRRAKTVAETKSVEMPPDSHHRYAAYLGSFVEDPWGQPAGYFFRDPKGRNENMMIVNPNIRLPPPDGAHFSSGVLDWENTLESLRLWKQWSVTGWMPSRVLDRPCFEVDRETKASGRQSIRFDPIRSKGYYEQYLRGIAQTIYCKSEQSGPLHFSFHARAADVPEEGTGLRWCVEVQSVDDRVEYYYFPLDELGEQWTQFQHTVKPKVAPFAMRLALTNAPWWPDPTVLWIDNVRLTAGGNGENLLVNGDFERAELIEGEADGVYLDTMECYANNLNYRREHWAYADEPPTFDVGRRVALQQQFSHVGYAKAMSEWLHARGKLVFGNCVPGTVFGTPHLDICGGEENWMAGDRFTPKSDEDFNHVRFMCRAKPFCLLQYADLDGKHIERYVKRCVFYGVWPGNQSTTTTGKWYWTDPVRVARDRPTYVRYMPALSEITTAGWQPITLARADNPDIWLERFGQGQIMYLTIFNATDRRQSGLISLDKRAGMGALASLTEVISGKPLAWHQSEESRGFRVSVEAEDVQVVRITR